MINIYSLEKDGSILHPCFPIFPLFCCRNGMELLYVTVPTFDFLKLFFKFLFQKFAWAIVLGLASPSSWIRRFYTGTVRICGALKSREF